MAWPGCSPTSGRGTRVGPPRFPPLQRAQIVELACLEPVAEGLHITHWSADDLARQAVADGIVKAISAATIRRILHDVDLQPHRTRYWRTPRLDPQFKERAEKVLWCYAWAERLARRGLWVVCADEMPNRQVLERQPIRRAIPGSIERQEFEYTRHGTVTILTFLIVHTGRMEATCLESNDAEHYPGFLTARTSVSPSARAGMACDRHSANRLYDRALRQALFPLRVLPNPRGLVRNPGYVRALRHFRRVHRGLKGVYLIQDGGPSHTAALTNDYFVERPGWWRPRLTPAHASWLNQGELLNHAFDGRYLKRGSWSSREGYIAHVAASWPEYNLVYAHPFAWTWTNQKMRRWFEEHAP